MNLNMIWSLQLNYCKLFAARFVEILMNYGDKAVVKFKNVFNRENGRRRCFLYNSRSTDVLKYCIQWLIWSKLDTNETGRPCWTIGLILR